MNRPFQPSCVSPELYVHDGFTVHYDCRRKPRQQQRRPSGVVAVGGGAFWLMLSSRSERLGSTHLPLSPFLCLKGTIYEKMHHLYFLKAPTSGAQQNLFFHSAGSLFPFIFPLFLAALGSSRRPQEGKEERREEKQIVHQKAEKWTSRGRPLALPLALPLFL